MKNLSILSFVATCIASSVCGYGQEPGFQVKPAVGKPTNSKAVEAMVVQKGVETDSLKPFPVLKRPIPSYLADENRHFQGCPSVTMSKGGRLWCTWLSGAATESQDNALVGATSGDGGRTWSEIVFAIDKAGPLRPLDAGLWTAPDGNVYMFYSQLFGFWDGRGGLWVRRAADPEDPDTDWIEPRRICDGYLKNKPTLLKDGRLLLPVEFFEDRYEGLGGDLRHFTSIPERFRYDSAPFQHANVFLSSTNLTGAAFLGQSRRSAQDHAFPENMIVERRDGSLWMLTRTCYGIGESVSTDGGKTWADTAPCAIRNTSSRFYLGWLRSGALLLVKNGRVAEDIGRARITAVVSDDEGRTWTGGLVLDGRNETSYPDACEGADGFIHVVNDWSREKGREIVHHRFTEADVRAGRLVTPGSRLGSLVNKAGCAKKVAPVKVILDTDMISDFDDVGALACLHALADAGECEILATVSSTRGNASVAAIEVINAYYGRGDLPVGAPKGIGVMGECPGATKKVDHRSPLGKKTGGDGGHYKYRKLAADYPNWAKHVDADDAPDANEVYRKILAAAPDKSVVICSIGFLTNLRRLLETKPDAVSPLDGRALVAKKVKLWVAMACSYPFGKEYNSMSDAESSKIVLENWTTPVVFSDFQYGYDVYAGRAVAEMDGPRNPVKDVFAGNIPTLAEVDAAPSKWMRGCFGRAGRAAWDETAVLAAVRGADSYFNVHRGTYRMIGSEGEDEWVPDEESGPHLRLTEKVSKQEIGKIIDELICRGPRKR